MEEQKHRGFRFDEEATESLHTGFKVRNDHAAESERLGTSGNSFDGDSFYFYTPSGQKLEGTKSLSLEILGEVGMKSAGKGLLRVDYTGVFQDMLRTIGIFPICVMVFSVIGFLLYRFPANDGEWWIFQYLTVPSMLWLAIWRWFETYYIIDVAQRRLKYRVQLFGRGMSVFELPRQEIIGITLSGQMMVDGWQYCVVAGMKGGSLVRLSDFSADYAMMARKAGVMARLLEVPLVEPRQEGFAEIHADLKTGIPRIWQMPGQGPTLSGGGCVLAFELLLVPTMALGFGWPIGLMIIMTYFWSRYWWVR